MATYKNVVKGIFCDRPNRFIANVMIDGKKEVCHVKNTGRCRELLVPGCEVFLEKSDNEKRKTAYDLIAVNKVVKDKTIFINMDSQIPNAVASEWILQGGLGFIPWLLKREVKHRNSRFDIYGEYEGEKIFVEVKGVTLEEDGIVRFPDAPTKRGVKHVKELIECVKDGYQAYILFVIQMKGIKYFVPNNATQPEFGAMLKKANEAGVKILAVECDVEKDSITARKCVPVKL